MHRENSKFWLLAGAVLATTGAVFMPVVRNGFINLDDFSYIYANPQVRRGLSWETLLWALRSTDEANWYPLRRLTHLVDVSLFGLWAGGHHLMSVGWHAAAALLLFAALRLMTGKIWGSLVVALLFAVHPLQVESVAWATERSNVLAGFFFALTVLLWVHYTRKPGVPRYGAVLVAFALGLASKPILVALPLLLLLLNHWPLGRLNVHVANPRRSDKERRGRMLLEQAPLLLLAALISLATVLVHRRYGAMPTLEILPLGARLNNASVSCWRYLVKICWPTDLAVYYPHPGRDLPLAPALLAGLILVLITVVTRLFADRKPWLNLGWLWFLVLLAPVIGIVPFGAHAMADRFAYLPSIGIFFAFVWFVGDLTASRKQGMLLFAAAGTILLVLSAMTVRYLGHWKDSVTLLTRTLAVTGDNWYIEYNLGSALQEQRRYDEAIRHFRAAIRIRPGFAAAAHGYGMALSQLGRYSEAEAPLRQALWLRPDSAETHYELGTTLMRLRRFEEASRELCEALRLRPDDAAAHNNLGLAYFEMKRDEASFEQYREALRLKPDSPDAHNNFGCLLFRLQRYAEAETHYREAARMRPDDADFRANLGAVLRLLGRGEEAALQVRQAQQPHRAP